MILQKVPLQGIDISDTRFRISLGGPSEDLRRSIAATGLISPPLLLPEPPDDRLIVVCGFRRLACVSAMGWSSLPALILDKSEFNPRHCLLCSYHDTVALRRLSTCEKAGFIARLLRVAGFSSSEILEEFCPALQLPANQTTLDRLLQMDAWPESVKVAASAADLAPIPILALADETPQDAESVICFLCDYRWGSSRQREICSYLVELARIRGQRLHQLVAEARSQPGAADEGIPLPQRAEHLRQWLWRLRFPQLAKAEESYRQVRQSLRLPPQIALNEPPGFEGDQYRIQFQFRSRAEFELAVAQLHRVGQECNFDELFRFV